MKFLRGLPYIFPIVLGIELTARGGLLGALTMDEAFHDAPQAVLSAIGLAIKPDRITPDPSPRPQFAPPPSVSLTRPGEFAAPVYRYQISPAVVNRVIRHYQRPQSLSALSAILGPPTIARADTNLYQIEGTDNGLEAGQRLVVFHDGTTATDWCVQLQ